MKSPDQLITDIAREHLGIPTLESRRADSLDFHNVAVWQVQAALKAALDAGVRFTGKYNRCQGMPLMTATEYSQAPWGYEYSPYTAGSQYHAGGVGAEIPAYQIFDADGNKLFGTNEDTPADLQEANARLTAAAPRLLASLVTCANLLADYDESDGEEGEAYRESLAAINEAIGRLA